MSRRKQSCPVRVEGSKLPLTVEPGSHLHNSESPQTGTGISEEDDINGTDDDVWSEPPQQFLEEPGITRGEPEPSLFSFDEQNFANNQETEPQIILPCVEVEPHIIPVFEPDPSVILASAENSGDFGKSSLKTSAKSEASINPEISHDANKKYDELPPGGDFSEKSVEAHKKLQGRRKSKSDQPEVQEVKCTEVGSTMDDDDDTQLHAILPCMEVEPSLLFKDQNAVISPYSDIVPIVRDGSLPTISVCEIKEYSKCVGTNFEVHIPGIEEFGVTGGRQGDMVDIPKDSSSERERRLKQIRDAVYRKRASETPMQRQARLEKDKLRQRRRRQLSKGLKQRSEILETCSVNFSICTETDKVQYSVDEQAKLEFFEKWEKRSKLMRKKPRNLLEEKQFRLERNVLHPRKRHQKPERHKSDVLQSCDLLSLENIKEQNVVDFSSDAVEVHKIWPSSLGNKDSRSKEDVIENEAALLEAILPVEPTVLLKEEQDPILFPSCDDSTAIVEETSISSVPIIQEDEDSSATDVDVQFGYTKRTDEVDEDSCVQSFDLSTEVEGASHPCLTEDELECMVDFTKESLDERERKLQQIRDAVYKKRASETDEQRRARLEKDKLRQRKRRAEETEEQREKRLLTMRLHKRIKRSLNSSTTLEKNFLDYYMEEMLKYPETQEEQGSPLNMIVSIDPTWVIRTLQKQQFKCAAETEEQRRTRLEKDMMRQRKKRAEETPEQRAKRLETMRINKRIRRAMETDDQRRRRLDYSRKRQLYRRLNETEEQRKERLEREKLRQRQKRASESAEERALRLQAARDRMRMQSPNEKDTDMLFDNLQSSDSLSS